MEKNKPLTRVIEISDGIQITKKENLFMAVGPKGTVEKKLAYPGMDITIENRRIAISTKRSSKKEKRLVGTFESHIKNLIQGVITGYVYRLKVCSGHFPMKVTMDKKQVLISNFLGEKIPRKANILDGVIVQLTNDIITVEGLDIEKTGQTAANIERATRITKRDRRVFQDGCYILKEKK